MFSEGSCYPFYPLLTVKNVDQSPFFDKVHLQSTFLRIKHQIIDNKTTILAERDFDVTKFIKGLFVGLDGS